MRERLPNLHVIPDARLRYLAGRIHALGERPLYELLRELDAGADLRLTLETYAALPREFIAVMGGDWLPPMRAVDEDQEPMVLDLAGEGAR
jgi:hypothetical protein